MKLIQQKKPLKYNILTHHVYIRGGLSASMHECPTKSTAKVSLQPAINRKGKYVTGGLTSDSLDFALSLYNATVDEARAAVQKALLSLCVMIEPHIRTLFYASTLVTVAQVRCKILKRSFWKSSVSFRLRNFMLTKHWTTVGAFRNLNRCRFNPRLRHNFSLKALLRIGCLETQEGHLSKKKSTPSFLFRITSLR